MKKMKKAGYSALILALTGILFVGAVVFNAVSGSKGSKKENAQNVPVNDEAQEVSANVQPVNYFSAFREDRETTRTQEMAYLDAIIADPNSDAEALEEAQQRKLTMITCMEAEFTIESLLRAKGFNDAAVTFHGNSVSVVVDAAKLSDEQAAQILEIVTRESGLKAENVTVSSSNYATKK